MIESPIVGTLTVFFSSIGEVADTKLREAEILIKEDCRLAARTICGAKRDAILICTGWVADNTLVVGA